MSLFPFKGIREDYDSETLRKVVLLYVFLAVGGLVLIIMGIIAFAQQAVLLGIIDFAMAVLVVALLVYLYKTGDEPTASRVGVFGIGFFFCTLFFIGGVSATAFMWLFTYPLISLYLLGLRQGIMTALLLFTYCAGLLALDRASELIDIYSVDFALRFIPSYLLVCLLAFLVEKSRYQTWKALFDKQQLLAKTVQELQAKEAELQESRNTLELRVAERTKELEQANERLRIEIEERELAQQERSRLEAELLRAQKMETLGRLAGGVAHDLNNVLSGIVSYPDLLLFKLSPEDEMRGPLQSIRRAGLRAAAIVQDLLALARRAITVKESVQVNDIVSAYLQSPEFITRQKQYPGVTVTVSLAPDVLCVLGSSVHLEKVLMNLLVNSFEAVGKDGTIILTTENRHLDQAVHGFETILPGGYVVLTVSDNGMGIAAESLNMIFEPFYSSKNMRQSGTGLGMTVVWGTIKDLGGYLDVVSSQGVGTAITIYLPALEGEEKAQGRVQQKSTAKGSGETVLLVDDEPEQRNLGGKILGLLGYRVETVASGEDALQYLNDRSVDLVLLDMIMEAGLDGLDTYRRILEIRPHQKVIIVSGYAETERTRLAMELGVRRYVQKPYTLEKIGSTILEVLNDG
jgi:two-component system, cell cycle sensor histidine kinase and response regulator CckA